jgi:tetratricopeptide (TPR) repeat protein
VARTVRIRRKDLKQPDEFITITAKVLGWARSRQRTLAWVAAGLLGGLVALSTLMAIRQARTRDANADLAQALETYRAGASSEAANQLAALGSRWEGVPAASVARVMAASVELRNGNLDTALLQTQEALADTTAAPYLRQQALMLRGAALEAKAQTAEALTTYDEATRVEGPYTAYALLSRARLLRAEAKEAESSRLVERVTSEFPEVAEREPVSVRWPGVGGTGAGGGTTRAGSSPADLP